MAIEINAEDGYPGTSIYTKGTTIPGVILITQNLPKGIDTEPFKPYHIRDDRSPYVIEVDAKVEDVGLRLVGLARMRTESAASQLVLFDQFGLEGLSGWVRHSDRVFQCRFKVHAAPGVLAEVSDALVFTRQFQWPPARH